ncbi:MAG: hypothetical protein MK212_20835, partial [Saprospiraceae bacterium]|nr:hypothetical protein [Saprospiraceae bacterium]
VSTKTIRRKIKHLPSELSKYVQRDGQKILIHVQLIEGNFKQVIESQEQKVDKIHVSKLDNAEEQHQTIEREQSSIERDKVQEQQEQPNMIEYLNNQLDQKDKQIAGLLTQNLKLTDTVNSQNKLISNMQQERKVLLSPIEPNQPTTEPPTAPAKKNKNRSDYLMMMILILLVMVIVLFVGKLD